MKKIIYLSGILMLPLLLGNCAGLRSGRGMSKGELGISYIPVAGASMRYGVTDYLETRLTMMFNVPQLDLYLHTSPEYKPANIGFTTGISFPKDTGYAYYTGVTLGKEMTSHIFPYVTYMYYSNALNSEYNDEFQVSIGTEFRLPIGQTKNINLLLVPEITYLNHEYYSFGFPSNRHFTGTINIGLIF